MLVEQIVLIVHVLIAIAIIGLILLQQGKGADMGASFGGGGSQTLFGPSGGGNALTRATAVLATLFFVTSFGLAIIAKDKTRIDTGSNGLEAVAEELEARNEAAAQALEELEQIPESLPDADFPSASDLDLPDSPIDDLPE